MKGTARSFGAITITNALPAGIGCAAGISLPVDAEVTLTSDGSREPPRWEVPPECRSPLVEASLEFALSEYSPEQGTVASLVLRSEIPAARGLKSSSAVSTAILRSVARATGRDPGPLEVARRCAGVGRRSGVSATGALDDALAGLESGFIVTDNARDEVLRRTDIDPNWGVALYIPPHLHPPSPGLAAAFAKERASGELAARAALDGDWPRAMQVNTELVERVMGYSYQGLRDRLRKSGAIASGVSGLGPTLAAIAPLTRLPGLLREIPADGAQTMWVPFVRLAREGG